MAVTTEKCKTFVAGEALEAYARVKLDSTAGQVVYADASDDVNYIGVTQAAAASAALVSVLFKEYGGTLKVQAADSFSAHATLYAADDGTVTDTATTGTTQLGYALEAATAAGGVIEMLPSEYWAAATKLFPVTLGLGNVTVHDAPGTAIITATATNDDLALVRSTATQITMLETTDYGGTTNGAQYAMIWGIPLPDNYVASDDVKIRVKGGMVAVADTTATVDLNVYEDGTTTDLCATTAQSINSTTAATKDFTITDAGLTAGDLLNVKVTLAVNDSGDASANIQAFISQMTLVADCLQ